MYLTKKTPALSFPRKRESIVFIIPVFLLFTFAFLLFPCSLTFSQNITLTNNILKAGKLYKYIKIDSTSIDSSNKTIIINFNKELSYIPFRTDNVNKIYNEAKKEFGNEYKDYKLSIRTLDIPIENLIPNYFKLNESEYDSSRIPSYINHGNPLIKNISKVYFPVEGLFNRNIVVSPSHGWYYNKAKDRWEWQRPRLFQSVEDKLALSIVVPYLIPMLEKAGANIFDPRERDFQTNEVVVDNDSPIDKKLKYYVEKGNWQKGNGKGFALGKPPYKNDYNPFLHGTFRVIKSSIANSAFVEWIPKIPETGYYAVYISYSASNKNVNDAHYSVFHSGIKTDFLVNQQIGGNIWEYLGKFKFDKGFNPSKDKVVLSNQSNDQGSFITADAVRFGGGMGIIERGGNTSNRPKYLEGSRYYLQYSGIPDSLYDFNNSNDDYNDDKLDRSKFVNYLNGGSINDKNSNGLGIPIDLSLALHTDAGITHNDTVIGTLALYSVKGVNKKSTFPNNISRLASRDLADLIQTQITNDIRFKFDPAWNRRELMNEQPSNDVYPQQYSEVYNPNVPSVLIELLSHQNFLDMEFALDPEFRFYVARSIYKGILRFLSVQNHFKYTVEPLPVKDFSAQFIDNHKVLLKWVQTPDSLEPTASAEKYIIYTRINNGDFDNGKLVDKPSAVIKNIKYKNIYSFKVTAVNKGGESFPSEILSVCKMPHSKSIVIIVNGFTRTSAPAVIKDNNYVGFENQFDGGVPDNYDPGYTGSQYDFDPASEFISNDKPGWGASRSAYESMLIAGNSFDYPYIHGLSIKNSGYSFVSASCKSVIDHQVNLNNYKIVDLILGEQRKTHWQKSIEDSLHGIRFNTFPLNLQSLIKQYCKQGGNIFISGSYVASDLFQMNNTKESDSAFAHNILKFTLDSPDAAKTGEVYAAGESILPKYFSLNFNQHLNSAIYDVWAPDAVGKFGGSSVFLRYKENQLPAGVAYKKHYGTVVVGFPFETIYSIDKRNILMKSVLNFFSR